ncbi:PAS domain-containing protein [Halobiforma nitratireducens]|uniref:histidine kinase n=1 Tax=Halobiforma nitratireducens JCM 10879 TaxID=1227454 RepID=M0M1S8_9EURY|nr:PAS domain-containing protein [Halobiforma nitratireducens]EMA38519.1 multi-sensor signal transduction histidine kinase [Halobiforma nitratireducens JCM 10879]
MTDHPSVLYVDDAPDANSIAARLESEAVPITVERAASGADALERLAAGEHDCLVVGDTLADREGIDFVGPARDRNPSLPIVFYPANGSEELAGEAVARGASGYVGRQSSDDRLGTLAERIEEGVDTPSVTRSERLLTELAENTGRVLYVFSGDWEELHFVNSAYEELWGRSVEALRDDPTDFLEGIHPDDREHVREAMDALSSGESLEIDYRVDPRTEFERWVRVRGEPIRDGTGAVVRIAGFVTEITGEKRREQELRETKRQLEAAIQAGAIGTWEWHVPEDRLVAGPEFARTFGVDPDAAREGVSLERFISSIHEADRERVEAAVEEAISGSGSDPGSGEYEEEYRVRDADGEVRWVLARGHIESDEDGDPIRFPGTLTDITDRKREERERQATVDFLQQLYDVTTDPGLELEEKVARMLELGCDRLDLPYGFLARIDLESGGDPQMEVSAGESATVDGSPVDGTQTIIEAHGTHELLQTGTCCPLSETYCRRTLETDGLTAIPDVTDSALEGGAAHGRFDLGRYIGSRVTTDGELYGTLCFAGTDPDETSFTDAERTIVRLMNQWVSYELERHRARLELEQTNERLEAFASVVSHDLRNPLNVASGHLELARAESDSDHLAEVEHSLERIETLVEDLLTLAREGDDAIDPEPIPLAESCRRCWDQVDTGDAALTVDTDRTVRADPTRLRQLLENLFRNAIEHGDADTVAVVDLPEGFALEDDGSGIPADERDQVFETGYTDAEDGTGLGLSIVEQAVGAHGWRIEAVEPTEGWGGARFEVTGVDGLECE